MINLVQLPGRFLYQDVEKGIVYTSEQVAKLVAKGEAQIVQATAEGYGREVEIPSAKPSLWQQHKNKVYLALGALAVWKLLPKGR